MKNQLKYAIVTGASSGIGRKIAVSLATTGIYTGLVARSMKGLYETLKQIKGSGGIGEIFRLDLRDVGKIITLSKSIGKKWGKVDFLINVAGIYHDNKKAYSGIDFADYSEKEIQDTLAVGINAPIFLSWALIPLMGNSGKIINISGTFESGAKGWLPYYISKRAIEDLTVGLAQELTEKGIAVNCISPSDTATETYAKFFPQYINEAQNPQRIADFVLKLCLFNDKTTGKVFVIRENQPIIEGFHK